MPKLSDSAVDARRAQILRAAELCFARDGFHQTTIAAIREQAQVSTGAIYTYFANKEVMLRTILERAREDRQRELEASGETHGRVDATTVLLRWVTEIFTDEGQHRARVDVNLWAEAIRNPRIGRLARNALQEATSTVSTVAAARLQRGGGSVADAQAVASVLIALLLGLEVQTAVGLPLAPEDVLRALAVLFQDQLQASTEDTVRASASKKPNPQQRKKRR